VNVLITGGSGYVGSKLVEMLATTSHYVTVFETQIFGNPIEHLSSSRIRFVEGDIRDVSALKSAAFRADCVIHLAGVVTDELVDMNPSFGHSVNVTGTENVVEACRFNEVPRLIYASSSSVYGETAEAVIPDETHDAVPKTLYAEQKLAGEKICLSYSDASHVATAVRQATAMGPAPRMRLDTVVNIFSKQAWFDGVVTPFGGEQYRSNIHVRDAAGLYITLLHADPEIINGQVWNWTDENLKVKEIAFRVAEAAQQRGKDVTVKVKNIKDNRSYRLNADKARRVLGMEPAFGVSAAANDNFTFFAESKLDADDPIYYNNKRMADVVKGT
jgi:nucleoside-diphosphate-sugar epimerase